MKQTLFFECLRESKNPSKKGLYCKISSILIFSSIKITLFLYGHFSQTGPKVVKLFCYPAADKIKINTGNSHFA
jgi:hypothetical protein